MTGAILDAWEEHLARLQSQRRLPPSATSFYRMLIRSHAFAAWREDRCA